MVGVISVVWKVDSSNVCDISFFVESILVVSNLFKSALVSVVIILVSTVVSGTLKEFESVICKLS